MTRNIAVVGSGYMGGGIAQVLGLAGARVALTDVSAEVAQKNYDRLIAESRDFVADGLFPEDATETLQANLWPAASLAEAVADADFIEECVPEVLAIKHDILGQISAAAKPDAIIGSNTSTISIGEMATAVTNPGRFLGVHFSNPSPFIPGVEIIPHAGTDENTVTQARELIHESGKSTAVVKDVTGFVLNRLQYALFHEATQLVEDGTATPRTSTRWCGQPSASGCRSSVRSPLPTWPAWTCTTSATNRCRPDSPSASRPRASSPTWFPRASSARRPAPASWTSRPSASRSSSRTATRPMC